MTWTALVPLKREGERKSRLASRLDRQARAALSERMAAHVLDRLNAAPSIGRVELLSPEPPGALPAEWRRDAVDDLNGALAAAAAEIAGPLLVVHADLPLLDTESVEALLDAAMAAGGAIAPDRHGKGTNALALVRAAGFPFAFGADSCARHHAALPGARLVTLPSLCIDVDTPDDLDRAIEAGFVVSG